VTDYFVVGERKGRRKIGIVTKSEVRGEGANAGNSSGD
jgi:hypothetical protein